MPKRNYAPYSINHYKELGQEIPLHFVDSSTGEMKSFVHTDVSPADLLGGLEETLKEIDRSSVITLDLVDFEGNEVIRERIEGDVIT